MDKIQSKNQAHNSVTINRPHGDDVKVQQIMGNNTSIDQVDALLNYNRESDRLETFADWPHDGITKELLARVGFVFLRPIDIVKCHFCKVEIGDWSRGDDPLREHRQHAPQCPLISSQTTLNVPTDENLFNEYIRGDVDTTGRRRSSASSDVRHPAYDHYNERLESFTNWPRSVRQRPDEMADAGLFYIGVGDQVKCFVCGGGLKDWEVNDVPWDEHALWYGEHCMYVQLIKGWEFIKKVKADYARRIAESADTNEATSSSTEDVPIEPEEKPPLSPDKKQLCKICYSNELDIVLIPCMHVVVCGRCSLSISACPICRKQITSRQKIYFA